VPLHNARGVVVSAGDRIRRRARSGARGEGRGWSREGGTRHPYAIAAQPNPEEWNAARAPSAHEVRESMRQAFVMR
jgi:hypothetical protein